MTLTLEALAARIAALEDIEAIRQLKARYLRGCDLKQPEVVRDTLPRPAHSAANVSYSEFTGDVRQRSSHA